MRYLGLSLFFHLVLAGTLVLNGMPWGNITSTVTEVLEVEWLETSSPKAPSSSLVPARKISKPPPLKAKATDVPSPTKEPSKSDVFDEAGAPQQILSYTQELKSYIESNRVYPRQALKLQQSGTVMVKLQISPTGEFRNIDILQPSPFESLNQAALHLLRNLKGFKPPPEDLKTAENFVVPIVYQIREKRSM